MKLASLTLLMCLTLSVTSLQAEEAEQRYTPPNQAQYQALQQQLAHAEQLLGEQHASHELQLKRLREELKRQHQQLKETQAQLKPQVFTTEQTWFLIGAGVSIVAALMGALLRGRRKPSRQWIN